MPGQCDDGFHPKSSSEDRLGASRRRDKAASARDLAALRRDELAETREAEIVRFGADAALEYEGRPVGPATIVLAAAELLAQVAELIAFAAADRRAAAADREHARQDRLCAAADREMLARQLADTETDELTRTRTRAAGLLDLDREVERARRTGGTLVVVYVDVVGLKHVNDNDGHLAGDALLRRVAADITAHLRPYDVIMRLGGDEFLCVMSAIGAEDARRRFRDIQDALARSPEHAEIRTGFAVLAPGDTSTDLIARADGELLNSTSPPARRRIVGL